MPAVQAPMLLKHRDTPRTRTTTVLETKPLITWEKLPDDFERPDDPVDNLAQPLLAEALREAFLGQAHLNPEKLIATNFGITATVNRQKVVKAPDFVYVPSVLPLPAGKTDRKSYTPYAEGALPTIVMEFLSDDEGREYDKNPHPYPHYGKWYFYEQILKIPFYAIFEPDQGWLEVYQLQQGRYKRVKPSDNGRYWIAPLKLFLGVWNGTKSDRTGYWLRWWDASLKLLLWGSEKVQHAEEKAQKAELEKYAALEKAQKAELEKHAALEKAQQAEEKAQQAEKMTRRIVKQMLQANTDIALIMQITGLDEKEIENLKDV